MICKIDVNDSLNRVEINREALRHNFRLCKQYAGTAGVMAMVKADGYGHGMVDCARILALEGACAFGVAEVNEGIRLRQAGVTQPVFVFTGVYLDVIPALFEHDLTPVIVNGNFLSDLSCEAVVNKTILSLHVKVDAGMGRQGCSLKDLPRLIAEIDQYEGVRISGISAHLPMSDDQDSGSTEEIFSKYIDTLEATKAGLNTNCCRHIANSGGLLYFPDIALDMVRPGISLYGYYPDAKAGELSSITNMLQPVMRFSSRVIQVRDIPAGTGLGYGHSYVTLQDTRLAVVPVGYADGYLRSVSGKASVLIRGHRVSTLGRISMNLTLVDVSSIPDVCDGDEVVLLGRQGSEEISADEIAGWMNTISYEVLCLLGNLNDRYYVN